MHPFIVSALKTKSKKRSLLEYHVFAKFPCNSGGVRIAVVLNERTAQKIGNWADSVMTPRVRLETPTASDVQNVRAVWCH